MKKKGQGIKRYFLILSITIFFSLTNTLSVWAQISSQSLNSAWLFCKGDTSVSLKTNWTTVNIPHCFNTEDAFDQVPGYYRGPCWYKRKFFWQTKPNQNYWLVFEGVNQLADVFLNGKYLGTHKGGYTKFVFQAPLENGWNELKVKVDNSVDASVPPISGDWTHYGGIYRDVSIETTGPAYFERTNFGTPFVMATPRFLSKKDWALEVKCNIKHFGEGRVQIKYTLTGPHLNRPLVMQSNPGRNIAFQEDRIDMLVPKPSVWPGNLYNLKVEVMLNGVVTDIYNTNIGFRTLEANTNGLFLNGFYLKLKGVCRSQDWQGYGNAISNQQNRSDARQIAALGANFIRAGHHPMDDSFVDELDKQGILYTEEIPISDVIDTSCAFSEGCARMLEEMIVQHYNHPSVAFWGYMNEILLARWRGVKKDDLDKVQSQTLSLAKELEAIARHTDRGRITTISFHNAPWYNEVGLDKVTQTIGLNRYDGWYHGTFDDFGKYLDNEHTLHPNTPFLVSEYGAGSDRRIHSNRPVAYDFSPEYASLFHEAYWPQIMARKWIIGSTVWNFSDFGSEVRDEATPNINNKGLVTFDRKPKDIYYFYQAAWTEPVVKPIVHIAMRDWETPPLTDTIKVYTNGDQAELFVDGKSIGKAVVFNYCALFEVKERYNELQAVSYRFNRKQATDTWQVPEEPLAVTAAFNLGSSCSYYSTSERVLYKPLPGFGKVLRIKPDRPGSGADIKGTTEDPLYQTAAIVTDTVLEVPVTENGKYEITFKFAELNGKAENLLYDVGATSAGTINSNQPPENTERIFNVFINDEQVIEKLDLPREYGVNQAVDFKIPVWVKGGKIVIRFEAIKGQPILNGLLIEKP